MDAQRWLRSQLDAVDRGAWVNPQDGRVTFSSYFAAWSQHQVWTDGTLKAMSLAARRDLQRSGAAEIRPTHVEAWVKSMTVPQRPAALAPGTVKTRFVNVRSVFRAAVRDRVIAADPTDGVRLPRQREREAR